MVRPAVPASLARFASCLAGVAKTIAILSGRGRPSSAAKLDDRMLQDIGLTRHDLWTGAEAPQFRTMADLGLPSGRGRPSRGDAARDL